MEKENNSTDALLAYYFEYNGAIFREFVRTKFGLDDFSSRFEIIRESVDNIDLLIKDDKYVLVIENKIKSGINGIRNNDNYSQLNKYQDKIERRISDPNDGFGLHGKISYYCIFTPNYNHIDISKYGLKKTIPDNHL